MDIKNFTPAQTLMITQPIGVSGSELMKYSFLDLVYRGILKIYKDWRTPHPNDVRDRLYTFVVRGERFETYQPSYHQDPFVNHFKEDDYEYKIRTLLKHIYNEVGKGPGFKTKWVYQQLRNDSYFNSSFGLKNLNFYFLNSRGSDLKRKFRKFLKEADQALPKLVKNQKDEAKKILATLGSNVLLLECFNDELIEQLKPMFTNLDVDYDTISDRSIIDHEDMYELLFYSFLDTIDYFDSFF